MHEPAPYHDERARVQVLRDLAILDTPEEAAFDHLVDAVAILAQVPICLVSLVDAERQWFKAHKGLSTRETPRSVSFCGHAILDPEHRPLVIEDATMDIRFADNPLVTGEPRVVFYIGVPLIILGQPIGTLCIIDNHPRDASLELIDAMCHMGSQVEQLIELRRLTALQDRTAAISQAALSRMQALFSILETGIVIQDATGHIIHHNLAAETILGLSGDQLQGKTSHDERWGAVDESGERCSADAHPAVITLRTGRPCVGVIMGVKHRDGACVWVRVNSFPLSDAIPGAGAVMISFVDITDERNRRLEADKAAKLLAQQIEVSNKIKGDLQRTIDTVPVLISYWGKDLLNQFSNQTFCSRFGMHPSLILGKHLRDVIGSELVSDHRQSFERVLHGEAQAFERTETDADGTARHYQVRLIPDIKLGQVVGFFTLGIDISPLQQAKELAIRAQEHAEAANRAKGDFLANMSHETRTPLNGVIGMLSLLLDSPLSAGQREQAEIALKSGEALLTILNDILDFSAIESGRFAISDGDCQPVAIVTQCLESMREMATRKNIRLFIKTALSRTLILGTDEGRIRQVVMNLLGNAIKFTRDGTVTLAIDTRQSASPSQGVLLRIAVSDTGIGIADEHMPLLFKSFSQADSSITRKYGGTGLGLAISQRLCRQMGGDLTVVSKRGQGSTFTAQFACTGARTCATVTTPPQIAQAPASTALSGRILVVEDHPDNAAVTLAMLQRAGLAAEVVVSGDDALLAIARTRFDLILMDYQMPGMDGIETTRQIRSRAWHGGDVPIIGLTANAYSHERDQCLLAGMNAVLTKPVRFDSLVAALAPWLTGTDARAEYPS